VPEGKKGKGAGIVPYGDNQIALPKMDPAETLRKTTHAGREMAVISLPEGVGRDEFKDVVAAAYMAYVGGVSGEEATKASGAAPTLKHVMLYLGDRYPEARVATIMGTKAYREACEARGIAMSKRPGLTQRQDLALSIILDPSAGKGLSQRLRRAGVKPAEYEAWKKNPVFAAHLDAIGNSVLKNAETDMMVTLKGLAVDGDLGALKFAFEVTGRHDPNQQQVMNAQDLMVQFISIIQRHVKDPDTLQAIASDFTMLASASGAAPTKQGPIIDATPRLEIEAD